jgi:hypothetical protein
MEVSKQNRDNIVQTMHAVNNLKHKITYNIFKLGRLYNAYFLFTTHTFYLPHLTVIIRCISRIRTSAQLRLF